jgi:hypothetical protein
MTRFERAIHRLSGETRRAALALLALHHEGELTQAEFELSVALVISRSQVSAAQVGDLGMAALVSRELGVLMPPLGLAASRVDQDRMVAAVRTILGGSLAAVEDRLSRLVVAEPAAQMQDTMQEAMSGHGATGWVRGTDANPCPLCITLADNVVRPMTVVMTRHPGCVCYPRPTAFEGYTTKRLVQLAAERTVPVPVFGAAA